MANELQIVAEASSNTLLTSTGVTFKKGITEDEFWEVGEKLSTTNRALQWYIGDWINAGESRKWKRNGESIYDAAVEMFGLKRETLHIYASVCRSVKTLSRLKDLSFEHHRLVAPLDEENQRRMLAAASAGKVIDNKTVPWTVSELQEALKKDYVLLSEYEGMDEVEWERLLNLASTKKFNKQDTDSIEWARWSWNPVTGCRHGCPYCYARDIANRFYAQGFEPSIYPSRLWAPYNTGVPVEAKGDTSYKNVFTCSMADLFGRWVPDEWINLVLDAIKENSQWNFLILTKFPQRMPEFSIPPNAWMGTTVDCQPRVAAAEKAFRRVNSDVRWISVEPMLTPLKFGSLSMFNWVVFGGASQSSKTPIWVPPFDWVSDLHQQARKAKCAIYHKTNLGISDELRLVEFPWENYEVIELPEEFCYGPLNQTKENHR